MIIVIHNFRSVIKIIKSDDTITIDDKSSIGKIIYALAKNSPDQIIVWVHIEAYTNLNNEFLQKAFPHNS